MLHQKKDLHSCYFAAQTMRTKIQSSFHELPVVSHTSLRDSLLEHISQITKNTDAVIVTQVNNSGKFKSIISFLHQSYSPFTKTFFWYILLLKQLCLALADLILQMASWQDPVIDLVQKFGNNEESLWPLLEILIVLPEEINSRFLRLGDNRRQQITDNFTRNGNCVLEFFVSIIESSIFLFILIGKLDIIFHIFSDCVLEKNWRCSNIHTSSQMFH